MLPRQASEASARGARSAGKRLKEGVAAFRAGDKAGDRARVVEAALLGKDGFVDRIRGKMADAIGSVTKPFDPDELISTIKRCLDE